MSISNSSKVLAIGIDAAEPTLIRRLIEEKQMPVLESLLGEGKWLRVKSPAHIGSGSVWPTFITGEEPTVHGVYSEWLWQPARMKLERYHGRELVPFWKELAREGVSVGVLDVPFAIPVGLSEGFEIFEWWAHDMTDGHMRVEPREILSIVNQVRSHPLTENRFGNAVPDNHEELKKLSQACIEGVRLRGMLGQRLIEETKPRLCVIVFPECHHAGHQMWHTVVPGHDIYHGKPFTTRPPVEPALKDIYREVDQQIGRLINAAGSAASVFVFSLHGMRAALGSPGFLPALLCEHGFSALKGWRQQSWTERALALIAATKRNTPIGLRKLYYSSVSPIVAQRLAQPTMMPQYDWTNTRAFSLPTDQFGWIRINLTGREAEGSVSPNHYDDVCRELQDLLLSLKSEDGMAFVRTVNRTTSSVEQALVHKLPDLVVHWEDAIFRSPLTIKDSKIATQLIGIKTGQHASEGFCILNGSNDFAENAELSATDLHRLITGRLDAE